MTSQNQSDLDSVTSSPRSDHHRTTDDLPRVRFMCSFGGKILPRPHDNQLRYVGGDTRIVTIPRRAATFSSLHSKLSKLAGETNISVKYQLPSEDLDSLITVTGDEDLENMMDEYDRLVTAGGKQSARLRLFLFSSDSVSRASSISSLLDGSTKREHWFLDALNGGGAAVLEGVRSEVSSIVSEVPDYLFGLENSEDNLPREPKLKSRFNVVDKDNVSVSDPGSPAPVVSSSPFCSTSSSLAPPPLPDLPPVKTKPDNFAAVVIEPKETPPTPVESPVETNKQQIYIQQTGGYTDNNPIWPHYPGTGLRHLPVYYLPGQIQQQQQLIRTPFVQQPFQTQAMNQVPVGFHQHPHHIYGGINVRQGPPQPYDMSGRPIDGTTGQPIYYGLNNSAGFPGYAMAAPAPPGDEDHREM
ncbi:uncharacterized protein LOC124920673 [Impatiens glandulifera]|uniref:uncharacterized protein LOC124920673 n=1 Tax=Impatiens glandulifera TaxID=253017 RepID=UPI001FB15011|nr:uncharacterized protein LOC124920673 [Impatiens glandulifera]